MYIVFAKKETAMNLSVDDQKSKVFVELEKKTNALKDQKDRTEKAREAANGEYNNARAAAFQGQAGWEPVGAAHVRVQQLSRDFERLSGEWNAANNDLQQARGVFVEECLRAARAA